MSHDDDGPPLHSRARDVTATWSRAEWADAADVLTAIERTPVGAVVQVPPLRSRRSRGVVSAWADEEWADLKRLLVAVASDPIRLPPLTSAWVGLQVATWDSADWADVASLAAGLTADVAAAPPLSAGLRARLDRAQGDRRRAGLAPVIYLPAVARYDTARVLRMSRTELEAAVVATARHVEPAALAGATDDELRARLKGRPVLAP